MKARIAFILALVTIPATVLPGYRLLYREELYTLYHQHLYQYSERVAENIVWLESALRADYANPLNALAVIRSERDWERYRYLFEMQLNLLLVESYVQWAARYTKREAYFFNAPFREQNLESLEIAENLFETARYYWFEAATWSARASDLRTVHLPEIENWADRSHRIETRQLDYERIIDRHLARLEEVRRAFLAMDDSTY